MDRTAESGRLDERLHAMLREVRDAVCSRCSRQSADVPPPCGGELTLCQLIQALLPAPLAAQAECPPGERPLCPLPPDDIAELASEVADELERKQAQQERLLACWDD